VTTLSDAQHSRVTLSILDRLTDLEPGSSSEGRSSEWEDLRTAKGSLCRDLAAILNTRRREDEIDSKFEEVNNSVATFGVADFTSYNLLNGVEQERVRRSIERAVRCLEPRLTRVTVTLEPVDPLRPMLQFQIHALLRIHPAEPVSFSATLYRDSRRVAVSGAES
jgi:type VI secretion system protein ImpF